MQIELLDEILDAKVECAHKEFYQKAAELFFKFSRFEHLLKENGYLQSHNENANAMASLNEFLRKYSVTKTFSRMPNKKIIKSGTAEWSGNTEPYEPAEALRRVRNNLFHGEKNPVSDEDLSFITDAIAIIDECYEKLKAEKVQNNTCNP